MSYFMGVVDVEEGQQPEARPPADIAAGEGADKAAAPGMFVD